MKKLRREALGSIDEDDMDKVTRIMEALQGQDDPALIVALYNRLGDEVKYIALPWHLHSETNPGHWCLRRKRASDGKVIIEARPHPQEGWWIRKRGGKAPTAQAIMNLADLHLGDEYTLIPGRPTAGPWRETNLDSKQVRVNVKGPPKASLARVTRVDMLMGTWAWSVTHLAGPGPMVEEAPIVPTLKEAQKAADAALEDAGWLLT